MKRRNVKSLQLRKKSISNLKTAQVIGANRTTTEDSRVICRDSFGCTGNATLCEETFSNCFC
ncbi:hypothetical protein [Kordia jejudonensis]|uniref:hypothetical protein n=1 Tax=Kordia jejudonensis TaxID=1348245 RepID=UPI00062902CD|nr:hypothetical protein [Kordia jejudonensis]